MARRIWSMARVEEIQRLIKEGLSDRQIALTLRCRRTKVREIRGLTGSAAPTLAPMNPEPLWALGVEWQVVFKEIQQGFEIKRIWEERAATRTSYSNFWKFLSQRYPGLLQDSVTLREFDPGTHCEVDWAGDTVPWLDSRGRIHQAHVLVAVLCHSQLIFAWAAENEQKSNWLTGHEKMYAFFKGVPRITVPDNLKTGVSKSHLYDPDLNPTYTELAAHYGTAIIPARVRRPKDKALVENAVGLVSRLLRWVSRDRKFHSLAEINAALTQVIDRINGRAHSRFKTSRLSRWQENELKALKPLPETQFEQIEWKKARIHPDCTIALESTYYSVPHLHRGKEVRVKLTAGQVEIFLGLERVAIHPRERGHHGRRVIDKNHFPPNSLAYLEMTPQNLLSQARFISSSLHSLLEELFKEDPLGHLRRAQGFVRHARIEISRSGRDKGEPVIAEAVEQMKRFGRIRVTYFAELIEGLRKKIKMNAGCGTDREIIRIPGNPMLREPAGDSRYGPTHSPAVKGPYP